MGRRFDAQDIVHVAEVEIEARTRARSPERKPMRPPVLCDLKNQLDGRLEPLRDWFPLSSYSAFTSVMDMLQGADAPWGWSSCNCHPNCGIFTLIVVNKKTNQMTSLCVRSGKSAGGLPGLMRMTPTWIRLIGSACSTSAIRASRH